MLIICVYERHRNSSKFHETYAPAKFFFTKLHTHVCVKKNPERSRGRNRRVDYRIRWFFFFLALWKLSVRKKIVSEELKENSISRERISPKKLAFPSKFQVKQKKVLGKLFFPSKLSDFRRTCFCSVKSEQS